MVVILDNDSAVDSVMATAIIIISKAPITPALPTTQEWRIYMITPKMVRNVGVKTPAIVPNFFTDFFLMFSIQFKKIDEQL